MVRGARVLPGRARGAAVPRPGRRRARRARHRHHAARGDRHERRRSAACAFYLIHPRASNWISLQSAGIMPA